MNFSGSGFKEIEEVTEEAGVADTSIETEDFLDVFMLNEVRARLVENITESQEQVFIFEQKIKEMEEKTNKAKGESVNEESEKRFKLCQNYMGLQNESIQNAKNKIAIIDQLKKSE